MSTPADNSSGGESRSRNPVLGTEWEKELDLQARPGSHNWGVGARNRSCELRKAVGRVSKV